MHWDLIFGQQRLLSENIHALTRAHILQALSLWFCFVIDFDLWLSILCPDYVYIHETMVNVYMCTHMYRDCESACAYVFSLSLWPSVHCVIALSPRLFSLFLSDCFEVLIFWCLLCCQYCPPPPCAICSQWSGSFSVWLLQAYTFLTWGPGWQHTWGVPGLPALCTFHLLSRLGTMSPPGLSGSLPQALWGWWLSGFGSGKDFELFPFMQPFHIE